MKPDETNPTFEAIYNDFMEWRYEDNPEFANNVGDHRFTDRVEDYSLEAFETRKVSTEREIYSEHLGNFLNVRIPSRSYDCWIF